MKPIMIRILLITLFSPCVVFAQMKQEKFSKIQELGGIEEYLYEPNGLNLLLLNDNSAPVVTVQIVYRVGSKHEVPGNTGSTHLLEHLMFKGTEKFNKRKGTSIDGKLNSIGARMNATTWNDRTNYYATIPSDRIELALEIEADRMRNSLLLKEDKAAEMTVVRNEFERSENNPNQVLRKEIWATAYMANTYHHSTIGWRSDIEKMPIEILRKFYNTYYWPDNATLTIIGDFEKKDLFRLVDKYFGKITRAPHKIPQPYTEDPQQYGPRKVVIKKPGQMGIVSRAYKIPGRMHDDLPALTVLGELIGSGPSSVLSRTFVDSGLGIYSSANASQFQEVGLFTVVVGLPPLSVHEDIENKIDEVIEGVKKEGVIQASVDRIIASYQAKTILSRDGSGSIASALTEAIAGGDWREYVTGVDRISQVTALDVKRVANKYLLEDQSTTGYFIPKLPGANHPEANRSSNLTDQSNGKHFYRHPDHQHEQTSSLSKNNSNEHPTLAINIMESSSLNYDRKEVAGIDIISVKTGSKGFVNVKASFPIGTYFNTDGKDAIPSLTARILSKGTTRNDKFEFSEQLKQLGVNVNISAAPHHITIGFKCLTKDVNQVMALVAEELRYPLFDPKEFELLKQQTINRTKQGLSDPGVRGNIALQQTIYPSGHPNYMSDIETTLADVETVNLDQLKAFHKKYFGPASMHMVVIGDVDSSILYSSVKMAFKGWSGGEEEQLIFKQASKVASETKIISIPQKPSAQMLIGQYTGLKRNDADFYPFYLGNAILGKGFSGRLMKTVRDEEGLTYSIRSSHAGHTYCGGYWKINASFNPKLFQQGLDATIAQLTKWVNEGVSDEELSNIKSNINGSFKVGLATTSGLSEMILSLVERGLEPDYIDEFPKDINAVSLEEVNGTIKKYINLDKLIIVKSGSLDQKGNPLE